MLVEWDAERCRDRAERLRCADHEVLTESEDGQHAYRLARQNSPDVVVLDLGFKASYSWQTARPLATLAGGPRLVLLDGDDTSRAKERAHAPDAQFVNGDQVLSALAG